MSFKWCAIAQLTFLFSFLVVCHGFARGPPWKMCALKIPKHGGLQQQVSKPPYEIVLSKSKYSPGENITVTLKGKTNNDRFRGFVIGAHPVTGDTENVVGKFVKIPENSKSMSWYAEAENEPNCVSHNGNSDKSEISFIWQAPSTAYGDLKFVAAIAKSYTEFWANLTSATLSSTSTSVPSFSASIQFEPTLTKITDKLNGCGSDHGCILYPRHCKGKGCEMIVTFVTKGKAPSSTIDISMMGPNSAYMSLAVSDDKMMGNDFTITCTLTQEKTSASLQNGYNPAYNNERHRIYNYSNVQLHYGNRKIYCGFRRPLDISITRVKVDKSNVGAYSVTQFDLRRPQYVFLAIGKLYEGTDVIYKHEQEPIITDVKVDFTSKNVYYGTALPILVRAHVSSMLIAWMFLAGIGMTLSANFKEIIVQMVSGAKLWFQLHRGIMVITIALTILGLIMVVLNGLQERSYLHGAFGLSLVVLCGLQAIMGIARPDPEHKYRTIFNWAHFTVGYGLHILAAAVFILALMMPHLPTGMRKANLVVVICWICAQTAWMILFRVVRAQLRRERPTEEPSGGQIQMEQQKKSDKGRNVMLLLLLCYVVIMLTFFAVCISFIAIY